MNKLSKYAFIVEGLTESEFLQKLIKEVFNSKDIAITLLKRDTENKGSKYVILSEDKPTSETRYEFLIVNCCTDSKVATFIKDNQKGLAEKGYSFIVGILDLYPKEISELHKFHYGLKFGISQRVLPVKFVISLMEIEAWFLSEYSHFTRIHTELTLNKIESELGLDISNVNWEQIEHPAALLNKIYQLVGERYQKKTDQIQTTVNSLDYASVYYELPDRVPSLKDLINIIEGIQ